MSINVDKCRLVITLKREIMKKATRYILERLHIIIITASIVFTIYNAYKLRYNNALDNVLELIEKAEAKHSK